MGLVVGSVGSFEGHGVGSLLVQLVQLLLVVVVTSNFRSRGLTILSWLWLLSLLCFG